MSTDQNREGLLEDPQSGSRSSEPSRAEWSTTDGDATTLAGTGGSSGESGYTSATAGSMNTGGTEGMTQGYDMSQIQHGWDVFGSDGEKVGDVSEVGSNYLLVTKGWLFPKDRYIPLDAITGVEHDRVYLNVGKDQIESLGWDEPPAADTTGVGLSTAETTDTTAVTQSTDAYQDTTYADRTDTGYTTTAADTGYRTDTTDVDDTDTLRVQRHEEELQAEKTAQQAGAVRVSKDVREEEQTLEVPVTREEVHVQSRTVDRPASDTGEAFTGGTVEVPVYEEDVQVRKEARVAEELEIGKTATQETERVTDTVRKEDVRVDEVGDLHVDRGDTTSTERQY